MAERTLRAMRRLMIVDDEKDTREGVARIVEESGLDIAIAALAAGGSEALDMLESAKPDIIICDIKMPMMDGVEFISQALKRRPGAQVIFISGYAEKTHLRSAIRFGAVDFLDKPFEAREMIEALEHAMLGPRGRFHAIDAAPAPESQPSAEPPQTVRPSSDRRSHSTVSRAQKYIQDNYASIDSIKRIAEWCYVSESHLCFLFKRETGVTLTDYITATRLDNALNLLKDPSLKVQDISKRLGFQSPDYFTKQFRKRFGMTPREKRDTLN
jgi:YesN/AraC family two-component response regulator